MAEVVVPVRRSKRLPQGDKPLPSADRRWRIQVSLDSGVRIQVAAEVNAHRPERSGVPQSNSEGIRIVRAEVVEADAFEDVAAVVEERSPEFIHQRER